MLRNVVTLKEHSYVAPELLPSMPPPDRERVTPRELLTRKMPTPLQPRGTDAW